MSESFNPEKAAGQQAVVQYEIGSPDGTHEYAMRIADGCCEIEQGRAESPRVTIRIGLGDFRPATKGPYGKFKVTKWVTQIVKFDERAALQAAE